MTFVIARLINNKIQIDSDTYVTDVTRVKNNIKGYVIKTVVISHKVTLSYAGSVSIATKLLEEIFLLEEVDVENIIKLIHKIPKQDIKDISFLLASNTNNLYEIIKISQGITERNLIVAWIGDKDAFSFFQGKYLPKLQELKKLESEEDEILEFKAQDYAFQEVIDNPTLITVSGFIITVRSFKEGLNYNTKVHVQTSSPQTIQFTKKNQWKKISFGDEKVGSYMISHLPSSTHDTFALAIFMEYGKFGCLFFPKKFLLFPEIISSESGSDFIKVIQERHGIKVGGLVNSKPKTISWSLKDIIPISLNYWVSKEEFNNHHDFSYTVRHRLNLSPKDNTIIVLLQIDFTGQNKSTILSTFSTEFVYWVSNLAEFDIRIKNDKIFIPPEFKKAILDFSISTK